MTVSQDLAEVLTQEAKSQRISRRELGERAGNKNALYKMEEDSTITVETFWKMCDVLGITAHDAALRVNMRRQQRREMEAMEAKAGRKG
jgi:transcriptional regulator with XRE-family HTH domain